MTLRELRFARPDLFYDQSWYFEERFMDRDVLPLPMPDRVLTTNDVANAPLLMSAASLAGLYAKDPENPIWARYLWTSDVDQHGQRVFVGSNGKGLEIHRHLHLTERWGCPLWS